MGRQGKKIFKLKVLVSLEEEEEEHTWGKQALHPRYPGWAAGGEGVSAEERQNLCMEGQVVHMKQRWIKTPAVRKR